MQPEEVALRGVADFRPNSVLAMIGNNEMSTQITIRLVFEKPSLQADQRSDGDQRHRLQDDGVGVQRPLQRHGQAHHHRDQRADHEGDRQAGDGDQRGAAEPGEDRLQAVPVEEAAARPRPAAAAGTDAGPRAAGCT